MLGMIRFCVIAILLLLVSIQAFAVGISYSGNLSGADGGLVGTGAWFDKVLLKPADQANWFAPTISWTVSQNSDFTWHYSYTLTVYKQEVSHFMVEVSDNCEDSNIKNPKGPFRVRKVDWYDESSGNPGLPGRVHALKFDEAWGTIATFEFDSDKAPVWGDLYAKDGKLPGTNIENVAWNSGFSANDIDPDVPAGNGSYLNHLLVPDSVPEPASFVSLAAGLMGILGLRRRSR
jgi:hypothetical protein